MFWVALSKILGIGSRRINQMVDYFGTAQAAWEASEAAIRKIPDFPQDAAHKLTLRHKHDPNKDWYLLQERGIDVVLLGDKIYPENLKTIFNPPATIYVKGTIKPQDALALAVVGARKPSPYGVLVAEKLTKELAQAGLCIVSGMARGIDTAAHRGSLLGKGRTIAVFGTGVDVIFPRENKKLMEEIVLNGAVVSEFPPGTQGEPWHFPARNRIISGLALGTLVVEAGEKSGSMITVDFALEQGRDVFAIPGNINNPMSKGPHKLIKQGAMLVEKVQDILDELGVQTLFKESKQKGPNLSAEEDGLFKFLSVTEPVRLEELIDRSGYTASKVATLLMMLELKGLVRILPGKLYLLNSL